MAGNAGDYSYNQYQCRTWSMQFMATVMLGFGALVFIIFGDELNRKSRKNTSSNDGPRSPPIGLANLGQTCFFNALLQALASCSTFVEWIKSGQCVTDENRTFYLLLQQVFNSLTDDRKHHCSLTVLGSLLDEIKCHGWVVENDEQDAHELFQAFISIIHKRKDCIADVGYSNLDDMSQCETNLPQIIFRSLAEARRLPQKWSPILGYLASSITCKTCLAKSPVRIDSFSSLSLSFPPNSRQGSHTLEDMLLYYFVSDNVNGVDCDSCTQRNHGNISKSDFLKLLSIGKLPVCLCLHVQRLSYSYHNGMPVKRTDRVVFPSMLNVRKFTQLDRMSQSTVRNTSKEPFISLAKQPHSSCYQLVALIEHRGTATSGHYVTYRKFDQVQSRWSYTSDLEVTEVTAQEVHSRTPYMLFYERL